MKDTKTDLSLNHLECWSVIQNCIMAGLLLCSNDQRRIISTVLVEGLYFNPRVKNVSSSPVDSEMKNFEVLSLKI